MMARFRNFYNVKKGQEDLEQAKENSSLESSLKVHLNLHFLEEEFVLDILSQSKYFMLGICIDQILLANKRSL